MHTNKGTGKKKKLILLFAAAFMAFGLYSDVLQAEEMGTKTTGNLEGVEMKLRLYEEDVDYLRGEIQQLLSECSIA